MLIGLLTGIMIAQPSIDRAIDDLEEARSGASGEMLDIRNTGIGIVKASHNNTTSLLNATIQNTGSTVYRTEDVDILVNGRLEDTSAYDGRILYPGLKWSLSIKNITKPASLKVVGPWGLSDTYTDFK